MTNPTAQDHSELVHRLREFALLSKTMGNYGIGAKLCGPAADAITTLTQESAALRAALDLAVSRGCDHCAETVRRSRAVAKASESFPNQEPKP